MFETIVSAVARYAIVLPPLVILWLFLAKTNQKLRFVLVVVLTTIFTFLLVKLGTSLHQDPRPFAHPGVVPYFKSSTDNGFPSDHTALSAALGFAALYFNRKIGLGLLLLSILIGSCRVIANVHHIQDIIGGFIFAGLGYVITLALLRSYDRHHSRAQPNA